MKEKINEDVLCILRYMENELVIDYILIENYFVSEVEVFKKLCQTREDNLLVMSNYFKENIKLRPLEKDYKYCKNLAGTYQGFSVNFEKTILNIIESREMFYRNAKNDKKYNLEEDIFELKVELENEFMLWVKAYNIEKAYRKCFDDKQILTFSHRINGWSNPEYRLSDNFTVELKTNFGYGSSSYFYIKIKYKDIEITPFSEWIDYEFARYSEITRYTKSFSALELKGTFNGKASYRKKIENIYWQDAIDFTKTACNISLKDEVSFVKKYIIEECEKMVNGLEKIYNESDFTFRNYETPNYRVNKEGHQLVEFRGEKISGALDFVSKILEFKKIIEIESFILRIENVNRKIQPLLVKELKNIEIKLQKLNSEILIVKPQFLEFVQKNKNYKRQKNELKEKMILNKELNLELLEDDKLDKAFQIKFPEFPSFEKEFNEISEKYKILTEHISNFNMLFDNITKYNMKILKYFEQNMLR